MAEEFHEALNAKGVNATFLMVARRNHNSIIFHAVEPGDPVAAAMERFVRQHVKSER